MGFDLSTGDDVRSVSLRSGLRGYDKSDVDEFRSAVADLIDDLRRRLDAASGHLAQLGLDDPLDLKEEFASVGKEVTAILEAARTAATDIRQRATADGEQWRSEAAADAERMRTDAWEEATTHLESALAEAQQTRASADEDALFIRAQAEKEAIRLTSEAKRDAEEAVRTARAEADSIRAEAREAAEAAQERTRALEVRREELMGELEEARRAIGLVESQIEEQHQRLMAPETTTVRIIDKAAEPSEPDDERGGGWLDADATVRLVPPEPRSSVVELEPVLDADDIVAEVERLQFEPEVDDPWSPAGVDAVDAPDAEPPQDDDARLHAEPPVAPAVPDVDASGDADDAAGDGEVGDDDVDVPEDAASAVGTDEPESGESRPATEASMAEPVVAEPFVAEPVDGLESGADAPPDGLADLFASLRTTGQDETPASPAVADEPTDEADAPHDSTGAPIDDRAREDDQAGAEAAIPAATAPDTQETETPAEETDDIAFEARESVLLPITNRALRAVKKQILEFQNVMLEATKADPDGWRPDAEEYRLALDPHVKALIDEAHRAAGGEGASGVDVVFGEALASAVIGATETMAGSGYRETSASLGRIYRSWRSDEAERRLAALASEAFDASTEARNPS